MAHAKLSPSASARWMTCPGSVHLAPDIKGGGSSVYAEKGTAMHDVSENCLTKGLEPKSFIGKTVNGHIITRDMVEIVQVYVNYIQSLNGQKFYEEKVTLAEVINDCYGTADAIIIEGSLMRVIDLKTGGGDLVEAEGNTQLLCYALGAYLKYAPAYDITAMTLTIVQPPKNNIDSWTISLDELLAFAEALKLSYAAIQNEPTKFVASDKACKWCHAKVKCPEMKRLASEAAAFDFKVMDMDTVEEWLPKLSMLNSFIEAVEAKAKDTMLAGGSISGWKVVEGRKTRGWTDVPKTELWLKQQGYDQIYTKPVLLSVAQMEIALKGESLDMAPLITIGIGQPTIAPEKDKRPSVDKNQSAKKDFEKNAK
jgi:hypothetical protein